VPPSSLCGRVRFPPAAVSAPLRPDCLPPLLRSIPASLPCSRFRTPCLVLAADLADPVWARLPASPAGALLTLLSLRPPPLTPLPLSGPCADRSAYLPPPSGPCADPRPFFRPSHRPECRCLSNFGSSPALPPPPQPPAARELPRAPRRASAARPPGSGPSMLAWLRLRLGERAVGCFACAHVRVVPSPSDHNSFCSPLCPSYPVVAAAYKLQRAPRHLRVVPPSLPLPAPGRASSPRPVCPLRCASEYISRASFPPFSSRC
jgi:hypothetical protein